MKRILFTCLLVVSTLTMFSQSKVNAIIDSTISTVQSAASTTVTAVKDGANFVDTSTISNKIYSDVKGIVVGLAKALGVAAERVYHVLTVHYMIEGITKLLLVIAVLWFLIWGITKLNSKCKDDEFNAPFPYVAGIIAAIIMGIGLFNTLPDILGMIFNSEYYTINHIIDLLKK